MATKPASESTDVKPIKRGRAPAHITQQDKDDFAEKRGAEFTQVQNTSAAIIDAANTEHEQALKAIHQRVGRRQAYAMVSKLLTVADLVDLQNIKESKSYKGYIHTNDDGKRQPVSTWDEFCLLVEGRSRQTIDNELLNLNELGPDLFESMRTVGIGPGTMRAIRQLPDDQQQLIQQAVETNNKEDLAEFVEQLIAKNVKEKETLTKQNADLQADLEAKDVVAKENQTRISELQQKAALLKKMPLEERAKTLRAEISQLVTGVDHELRTNLWNALESLRTEFGDDFAQFCKGQLDELQSGLDLLKQQFGNGVEWE